jgi:hypothetical protein
MRTREYCQIFGLNVGKGICSNEYAMKMREYAYQNYDVVISENLIKDGKRTRFRKGSEGRTREKMSEQTKRALSSLGKRTGPINIKKHI